MSWCRIQHQDIFVSLENQPLTCHDPKRESQRIPGNLIGQRDGKSEKRIFINGFAISRDFLIFVL